MSEVIRFEFADGRVDYLDLPPQERFDVYTLLDDGDEKQARSMFFAEQCDALDWKAIERHFLRRQRYQLVSQINNGVDFSKLSGYWPDLGDRYVFGRAMTIFDVYIEARS